MTVHNLADRPLTLDLAGHDVRRLTVIGGNRTYEGGDRMEVDGFGYRWFRLPAKR